MGFDALGGLPGSGDLESALILIVGAIILVLVVIPLLLFGIELIIVGGVLAATLLGRLLLGRPWVIEAHPVAPTDRGRVLEWKVSGWRHSSQLIRTIVSDLAAGGDPSAISETDRTPPE